MKRNNIKIRMMYLMSVLFVSVILTSCAQTSSISSDYRTVTQETKDYWYDGTAELTSYTLTQGRYGEAHDGTAVLVFVTEPFSKSANTKADNHSDKNVPVLKLNATKKFNTGIYPYSMMNSTFFPFEGKSESLKLASSLQEWCGMTYLEMKNGKSFTFNHNSYFEGFSFENKKVKKNILEDDLWSLIRLNPELLPVGEQNIIPSMFFLRLRNREPKSFIANAKLKNGDDGINTYELVYPSLDRTLAIHYSAAFPYSIIGWEDTHYSGYGADKKIITTKAVVNKTLKSDYWNQNLNKHAYLRTELGLE